MNWIKNLASKISELVRLIILVVIVGYLVYTRLIDYGGFLPALQALAPFILVIGGILYLQLHKKEFAAHLALFIGFFLPVGTVFLNSVLSFRFEPLGFAASFPVELFLRLAVFVYLLLMTISLFFTEKPRIRIERKDILLTAIIAFTFFYLRSGIYVAIDKLLLPVISLAFGLPLATIFFLVAGVADVPFSFINRMTEGNLLNIQIGYYLFAFFAFYLIYGAVKGIIQEIRK